MDNYLGEIRLFGGTFAPAGWHFCDGALLSISQNDALYALLGTIYGGDGVNTFGLPDLRGRAVVHTGTAPGGSTYPIGSKAGVEQVTLTTATMPAHSHTFTASTQAANQVTNAGAFLAAPVDQTTNAKTVELYIPSTTAGAVIQPLLPGSITAAGGSQPHNNMQPYVAANYIIALAGIYPTQN